MFNKIKQIKDLRSQAKTMQSAMAEIVVVGSGAKGNVIVTIDGNQKCQGVKIDGDMDNDTIAAGVKEAIDDAGKKLQKELASKMKDMGGLDAFKDMLG